MAYTLVNRYFIEVSVNGSSYSELLDTQQNKLFLQSLRI